MSTFNQKVTVVTEILKDNARQRRLTNRQELAEQAGRRLHAKGQKKNDGALDRYKLIEVLERIAQRTTDGVLLPALVVHYNDSRPGRRFADWARSAGVNTDHRQAVRDVFDAYGDAYTKSIFEPAPAPAFEADEDEDYEDLDDDVDPDDTDEGD
jgi:hypothetical protein